MLRKRLLPMLLGCMLLFGAALAEEQNGWTDDGFRISLPQDWSALPVDENAQTAGLYLCAASPDGTLMMQLFQTPNGSVAEVQSAMEGLATVTDLTAVPNDLTPYFYFSDGSMLTCYVQARDDLMLTIRMTAASPENLEEAVNVVREMIASLPAEPAEDIEMIDNPD